MVFIIEYKKKVIFNYIFILEKKSNKKNKKKIIYRSL